MNLITLKTFDNPMEAHLFRTVLENEGIPCEIFDELMVGLNPLYNITVGGVKLKIRDSDLEAAMEILNRNEAMPYTNEADMAITCPNCGSNNLYSGFKSLKGVKGFFTAIVTILLFVYPFYIRTRFRCKECDTEFKS